MVRGLSRFVYPYEFTPQSLQQLQELQDQAEAALAARNPEESDMANSMPDTASWPSTPRPAKALLCHQRQACATYAVAPQVISLSPMLPLTRQPMRSVASEDFGSPAGTGDFGNTPSGRHKMRSVAAGTTTLVVRNIPARYNQDKILAEWQPDGSFDMLFLPFDARTGRTSGCAYLNFVSHEAALEFQRTRQGSFLAKHGPGKHLDIAAATLQGLEANLRQFAGKSQLCESRLPALFVGRKRVSSAQVLQELGFASPTSFGSAEGGSSSGSPGASSSPWRGSRNS